MQSIQMQSLLNSTENRNAIIGAAIYWWFLHSCIQLFVWPLDVAFGSNKGDSARLGKQVE